MVTIRERVVNLKDRFNYFHKKINTNKKPLFVTTQIRVRLCSLRNRLVLPYCGLRDIQISRRVAMEAPPSTRGTEVPIQWFQS